MKTLRLLAVGGRPPRWVAEAEEFYVRQLRRFALARCLIRPAGAEKEAAALVARLPEAAWVALLDVGGRRVDSAAFVRGLEGWLARSAPCLVIAGAEGAAPALRRRANECLSLSDLTLPHGLARVVLVEQLFRADCVLRGHPYPR